MKPINRRKTEEDRRTPREYPQQPCIFCRSLGHRTQACDNTAMDVRQKRELLIRENRCCRCTKIGHRASVCRSTTYCTKCNKKGHLTPLCNPVTAITTHCSGTDPQTSVHVCNPGQSSSQYYITVVATAVGPKGETVRVRILFDSGSQSSFVRTEIADKLNIDLKRIPKIPVSLTMLNQATVMTNTSIIEFRLQNQEGGPTDWFKFYTLDKICRGRVQPAVDAVTRRQLQKLNIELSDSHDIDAPIDILIGTDQLVGIQTHNAHRLERTLEVVETAFGWALFGSRGAEKGNGMAVNHVRLSCLHCSIPHIDPVKQDDGLEDRFRRFAEADAMAIEREARDEDQQFLEEFMKKVTFDPKMHRFMVDLPFKKNLQPGLNLALARARLRSLERSLEKSKMREKYAEEIQSFLDSKFIEPVPEGQQPSSLTSYLPHKEVIKQESLKTKLRIVFDASAKEKGCLSLNDTLHTGPNLTQDMLAVLMRFRTKKVVLLADVEKSFPQIVIREAHRGTLRFLWRAKGSQEPQVFRLTRNYFGFASSSFILAICTRTLLRWHKSKNPETVAAIERSYYVDDLATGADSDDQAIRLYQQAKEIFRYGSFNLRKWTSNSPKLMSLFRQHGDGVEEFNVASTYNMLGMQYSPRTDSIGLKVNAVSADLKIVTKRAVLSVIASVFDRIGIVAPLLVPAKLLMQKMWTLRLAWDDPVPEQICIDFKKWAGELKNIESIKVPRRYWSRDTRADTTLHMFSDASQYAYGFCAYVVTRTENGVESSLTLAKSKVAPLRNATIPRLELMALALAAEAMSYIRSESQIAFDEEYILTDNSGVFYQATSENPEKLATFTRNRVQKIQHHAENARIRHVPGELNPADLVSRGCGFKEFVKMNG
ncbi:uncharacterized protein LOC100899321 [Galendromus occidentalis]|uniref:Uncharacterized protein LOC100899321 n=1 Tax=Galendromus occidentalis TaxID=34638 RepID=A0AAJ6QS55_9ACAR|nr:uncharacterized protein LOC100899321 [Galendromus occidentalis]